MRFARRLALIFSVCAVCALVLAGPVEARPIGLDDLEGLVRVNSPRLSPDGRTIVIVVGRANYEQNEYENQLVAVDVATGGSRPLTHDRPKVRRPRWSPDGESVAFIDAAENKKGKKKNQIFVLPMSGGEARQATHVQGGIVTFDWTPDGKGFVYVAREAEPDDDSGPGDKNGEDGVGEQGEEEDHEKHNKSFVVGHHDYLAQKAPAVAHLWHAPFEGERRKLNPDGIVVAAGLSSVFSVAPDGSAVAFTAYPVEARGDRLQVQVLIAELPSGKQRTLARPLMNLADVRFSPDGRQIAYSQAFSSPFFSSHGIHVASADGRDAELATVELDRNFFASHWMPDGKALIVGGSDYAQDRLWIQPLGRKPKPLDLGELSVNGGSAPDLHVGRNGALAFTATAASRPVELYFMSSVKDSPRRLTTFNAHVEKLDLGRAEEIRWQGPDGFEENGVLIYPPGFDAKKKYPLVLQIHGGPMSASLTSFNTFGQLLAARGWVVFGPNYRGSDNLGNAYQSAVVGDAGDGPGRDVMAGLEAVKKKGFVDESKIAVSGWSYGGYMTSWLIGNYPDVWAAAVAGAPVTDYVDQYSLSDVNVGFGWGFPVQPWTTSGQQIWRNQSPIAHVHKAKAPTLILCDTGDLRVPITESYKLFHALDDHGVTVEFVAYPVNGHFPPDPIHRMDVYRRWGNWIERWFAAE